MAIVVKVYPVPLVDRMSAELDHRDDCGGPAEES